MAIILDVILVLTLLGFLVRGIRKGLWITVGGAAGFLLGAIAAFLAIPRVAQWVDDPVWRIVAVIGAVIVLLIAGNALGSAAGAEIHRLFRSPAVRTLGSIIGGIANVVVAIIVIGALSFSVNAMGFATVNQQMKDSVVLRTIDNVIPDEVERWFAQVRTIIMESDIPELAQPLVPERPELPDDLDLTEQAELSAMGVARITGVAEQCGQSQSGSGVAMSQTRIITNAHVVAGVTEPTVELPNGEVARASVVYFNSVRDLAVLAVEPLEVPDLQVGEPLEPGDGAYVMGYPAGGPFNAGPALVQARDTSQINNIYGSDPSPLEIYQLNADVRQGNSGGPVIDAQGDVVGVVFARAVEGTTVGFAITAEEAGEVLTAPDQFTETVGTGDCISR